MKYIIKNLLILLIIVLLFFVFNTLLSNIEIFSDNNNKMNLSNHLCVDKELFSEMSIKENTTINIPLYIESSLKNNNSKIEKNIIQTYKNNNINKFIYNNIKRILLLNNDYNYIFITDEIAIDLIKNNFDENTLSAFKKLNIGSAKGDFIRYIAIYVYGGVYLDLDASIETKLDNFIPKDADFLFFYDKNKNIQQWCFMCISKNIIVKKIIEEMVRRINNNEQNIFLATGPTLVTDVIYNLVNNSNVYNVTKNVSKIDRETVFKTNNNYMNGLLVDEYNKFIKSNFLFTMKNYNSSMMYNENNQKYKVTYNKPTPFLYKK